MKNIKKWIFDWSEVTSGERNKIVFENLHKKYGAFEIRTNYDQTLWKSLSTITFLSIAISSLTIFNSTSTKIIDIPFIPAIQIDPPPFVLQPEKPTTTTATETPIKNIDSEILYTPLIAKDTVIETDTTTTLLAQNNFPGNLTGNTGTPTNITSTVSTPGGNTKKTPNDTVLVGEFVDEPPVFPGGPNAMFKFLKDNTYYPRSVIEMGGNGIAGVTFVLDKEGNVIEVSLVKSTHYSALNEEALRVVKKMPQWSPGKQHGEPVKVRMILPIRFELKQ